MDAKSPHLSFLSDSENDYIWNLLYANMTTVFSTWIQRGRKESPEELFKLVKKYSDILGEFADI